MARDESKRLSNLRKHEINFRDLRSVFDGDTVMINDDRDDYGETRFITFGLLQGRIVAIVKRVIPASKNKAQITLRIDDEVLEWFKSQGRGYQTQINSLLRAYMEAHRP